MFTCETVLSQLLLHHVNGHLCCMQYNFTFWGSLSTGVFVQGSLCSGESLSGGVLCSGVSLSGGVCKGDPPPGQRPCQEEPGTKDRDPQKEHGTRYQGGK